MTALKLLEMDKSIYIDEILSGSLGDRAKNSASEFRKMIKSTKFQDYDKNNEPKIYNLKLKTSGRRKNETKNEADKIDKNIKPDTSIARRI